MFSELSLLAALAVSAALSGSPLKLICQGEYVEQVRLPGATSPVELKNVTRARYTIDEAAKVVIEDEGPNFIRPCSGDCVLRFDDEEIFLLKTSPNSKDNSWRQLVWKYHRNEHFIVAWTVDASAFRETHLQCSEDVTSNGN